MALIRTALYDRAQRLIPGGVNSPVRAMRAVGLDEPLFMRSGEGAFITDVNGDRYLDWVLSWGPLLYGHADSTTLAAVLMKDPEWAPLPKDTPPSLRRLNHAQPPSVFQS